MKAIYDNLKLALEQQIKLKTWKTNVFFGIDFKQSLDANVPNKKAIIVCVGDEAIDDLQDDYESEYTAVITMYHNGTSITDTDATELKQALKRSSFFVGSKHGAFKLERGTFTKDEAVGVLYELTIKIIIA